jgi:hypothetical protein
MTEMHEKDVGLRLFTNDRSANDEFASFGGAYDMHSYYGMGEARRVALERWAQWSHARNMPFFVTEFGDFSFLGGPRGSGPKSYAAVLSNAETVLQGLSAGVDGFNRWSFLNRGDLDGQWQLVRTWDIEHRRYLDQVEPEPVPFMGYAMLTRFTSKHSDILETKVTGSPGRRQLAATLRSPAGNTTIFLLNLDNAECETTLALDGLTTPLALHPYAVSEPTLSSPGSTLTPGTPLTLLPQSYVALKLPPLSLTTLTTFRLLPDDPGITEDVRRQP